MKNLKFTIYIFVFSMTSIFAQNNTYQWSVPIIGMISGETKVQPNAFLWIHENCKQVRAVILGQHNMTEQTIFEHPKFRKEMAKRASAIVWVSPGFDMKFDFNNRAEKTFETIMTNLENKIAWQYSRSIQTKIQSA